MNEKLGKFAKSLRQGQTIYNVYALGKDSYIKKYLVCSRVKKIGSETKFLGIDVISYHTFQNWLGKPQVSEGKTTEHLSDMNALMGVNGYNYHRIFFSKRKAQKYLKTCIDFDLDLSVEDCYHCLIW